MAETEDVNITDRVGDWHKFLKKHYKKNLGNIAREYPHLRSLTIDYRQIEKMGEKRDLPC